MMIPKWWFSSSIIPSIIIYNNTLFPYLDAVPDLVSGSPFELISVSFWLALVILWALFHFLSQQDVLAHLVQSKPWNEFFLQELWLLLVENGFISHDLDSTSPHCCCWVSLLLGPLSMHLENRYMWHMCVSTHTHTHFCLLKAVSLNCYTDCNPTLEDLFYSSFSIYNSLF